MNQQEIDLFTIFAEDKKMVTYRPEWRKITGSVTSTILLQQIIFHWNKSGRRPFYKFKEPSLKNELYKKGDSWTEELGFGRTEFDSAIRRIGQKFSKKRIKEHPEIQTHTKFVEYWTDEKHLTWYTIHELNLKNLLIELYGKQKTSQIPCDEEECPLKYTPCVRESTNPTLGDIPKVQIILQENQDPCVTESTDPTLDLKQDPYVTESTDPTLDLITETTNKEETTTETTTETASIGKNGSAHSETSTFVVVDVVEQINSLLSHWEEERGVRRTGKRHKGERITDNFLNELCRIHSLLSPREVLHAVSALAPNPGVGSVLAVMKGSKNGNGQYESSCWSSDGKCLLGFDEELLQKALLHIEKSPGAESARQQGELYVNHEVGKGNETDWQAEFDALPEETKTSIRTRAEAKIVSHKARMKPEVYDSTLEFAMPKEFAEWKEKQARSNTARADTAKTEEVIA